MSKFNLSISNVITKSVEVKSIAKYFFIRLPLLKRFEKGPIKAFIKSFQVLKKPTVKKTLKF